MSEENQKPTVDVTNLPLMLRTSEVCKLTGLTDEYLHKLENAGVVESFQKCQGAHKFWRRDQILTLLGFQPITK